MAKVKSIPRCGSKSTRQKVVLSWPFVLNTYQLAGYSGKANSIKRRVQVRKRTLSELLYIILMHLFCLLFQFLSSQNLMDFSLLVGIHDEDRIDSEDELDADAVANGRSENDDSAEDSPSSPTDDRRVVMRSNSVTSGEVPMDGERYAIQSSRGKARSRSICYTVKQR